VSHGGPRGPAVYTCIVSAFIYPVVVHWIWSVPGWLGIFRNFHVDKKPLFGIGMIDFAGSGVVHMVRVAAGGMRRFVSSSLGAASAAQHALMCCPPLDRS
jgi:ammonia channel protein AmtB